MGLEISKRYSSCSFYLMWLILYTINKAAIREYKVAIFGHLPEITNVVALSNFNMGMNGKIAITWKRLIVEQNGWKFGTRGPRSCKCLVRFISNSLSSVWHYSVHFAKFPMLRFPKGYWCYSFHPISTKFYRKHLIGGNTVMCLCVYVFSGDLPILKVCGTLKLNYLSYITIIHTDIMSVLSGKGSSRASRAQSLLIFSLSVWSL